MKEYKDLKVEEICNEGVKEILVGKPAEEWTDYDVAIAFIYDIYIPEGKMKKELLIKALQKADRHTALALIKRPEAAEYREDAINIFIELYCKNWIREKVSKKEDKDDKKTLNDAQRSLVKTIKKWMYCYDIQITWNNMKKLFSVCNSISSYTAYEMLDYISQTLREPTPKDLMDIIAEKYKN